jgi:hypothetical protein
MNQQPQPTPPYPIERGDELDLIGLWKLLVKYKQIIFVTTAITTLSAIYYLTTLPTLYIVESLLVSSSDESSSSSNTLNSKLLDCGLGSGVGLEAEKSLIRLKTYDFLTGYFKKENLKPMLFPDRWDKQKEQWISNKEPSDRESVEFFKGMIEANSTKSKAKLTSIVLKWENPSEPEKMAEIIQRLIDYVNFSAQERAISKAKRSILFLEKEIESTNFVYSKKVLYRLIEQETQKIMMANINDEFIFHVIQPALKPLKPEDKPVFFYMFLGIISGIISGILIIIMIKNFKENYN